MRLFVEYPELRPFFLATAVIALHLLLLANVTGVVRTKRKVVVNPEDAIFGGATADVDHPDVLRTKRAHMNALENAVPFFAVGLCYAMSGPSHTGALAYFGTFVAARLAHSAFYLAGKQPFRTLSYVVGLLATIGMAVHVLRVALA